MVIYKKKNSLDNALKLRGGWGVTLCQEILRSLKVCYPEKNSFFFLVFLFLPKFVLKFSLHLFLLIVALFVV